MIPSGTKELLVMFYWSWRLSLVNVNIEKKKRFFSFFKHKATVSPIT